MLLKVTAKQNNALHCFVCGMENEEGLHGEFYALENGMLAGFATAKDIHQSYPLRVHGGVSGALLDEAIGRVIQIDEPDTWAVTVSLETQYRKPVPYGEKLLVVCRIVEQNRVFFVGEGAIYLSDGSKAVSARAKYMRLKLDRIADFEANHETWICYPKESDPKEIDIPELEHLYLGKK